MGVQLHGWSGWVGDKTGWSHNTWPLAAQQNTLPTPRFDKHVGTKGIGAPGGYYGTDKCNHVPYVEYDLYAKHPKLRTVWNALQREVAQH